MIIDAIRVFYGFHLAIFFRCTKEIHQGVKNLLSFINDIKGLALVRDAVYEILKDLPKQEQVMKIGQ